MRAVARVAAAALAAAGVAAAAAPSARDLVATARFGRHPLPGRPHLPAASSWRYFASRSLKTASSGAATKIDEYAPVARR